LHRSGGRLQADRQTAANIVYRTNIYSPPSPEKKLFYGKKLHPPPRMIAFTAKIQRPTPHKGDLGALEGCVCSWPPSPPINLRRKWKPRRIKWSKFRAAKFISTFLYTKSSPTARLPPFSTAAPPSMQSLLLSLTLLLSLLLLLLLLLLHALLVLAWARAAQVLDLILLTDCNTCSSVSLSDALICRTNANTAACACTASTPSPNNSSLSSSTCW